MLSLSNPWLRNNSISFKGIYAKRDYPLFFWNIHKTLWSRIKMISDTLISRDIFDHNYTYHLIFKNKHLIFSASCTPEMLLFLTSYPITENEFGHTVADPMRALQST